VWPQDAPRRNAGKFSGALEFGGERVAIRASRAAHDAPAELVASTASGIDPRAVVGHRPFDGKEPLIMVGDRSCSISQPHSFLRVLRHAFLGGAGRLGLPHPLLSRSLHSHWMAAPVALLLPVPGYLVGLSGHGSKGMAMSVRNILWI
jgi:hypothetical protein